MFDTNFDTNAGSKLVAYYFSLISYSNVINNRQNLYYIKFVLKFE